jgi:hypothetical protein
MNANKFIFSQGLLLLLAGAAFGQDAALYAGEAFRFSDSPITGTARYRGLGGNHAALGADVGNTFGNPAGLGFYNRSEISISPSLLVSSSDAAYLGTSRTDSRSRPAISQLGVVLAGGSNRDNRRWRRSTFAVTYSQTQNFSTRFVFGGRNNRSSIVDTYIEDANRANLTGTQIDGQYNASTNEARTPAAAAYQLFLIDGTPFTNPQGGPDSRAPWLRTDVNVPRDQTNTFQAQGAQSQWTLAYAGNLDDKLYLGGSLGLSVLNYTSDNVFREDVVNGQAFNNYSQRDQLTVSGNGINLSVGAIYKLSPLLQVGATVTTPTFSSYSETFSQSLRVSARNQQIIRDLLVTEVDVTPNDFEYNVTSPLRASGGLTAFLGKAGFVTATAEYVGYSGMRVSAEGFEAFGRDVRTEVQRTYQDVVNFRAGAEFRAGAFRIRGGAAYLPDAFTNQPDGIDRTQLLLTGGLGVRNERFFADIAGAYNTSKSAFTPYTLPNSADYASSRINTRQTTITLSVGTFF